jgi:hypothetical protein
VTLKTHCDEYVKHTATANSTGYKDQAVLDRLVESVGDRPIAQVTSFHVERWKSQRAGTVSKSTVNRELNIVRGCFSRAVEWGRLGLSPLRSVNPYRVDDSRLRVLSSDELHTLFTDIADPFVLLVCRITLECLARLSEALGLGGQLKTGH